MQFSFFFLLFTVCVQSCTHFCSTNCVNKTYDRFTGDCLCVCEESSNGGGIYLNQLIFVISFIKDNDNKVYKILVNSF